MRLGPRDLPPAFSYAGAEDATVAEPRPDPAAEQGWPAWLAPLARPETWTRAGTLEVGAWLAILGLAALLRLAALGDRPLGTDEAVPAVEAWRNWLGHPPRDLDSTALLTHLLTLLFGLLGASDFVARLPAAIAGIALAAAPLLLRGYLGRPAAVGAGAVLAISPLLVFGSRLVDSGILVAALLALLVGTVGHALATDDRRWAYAVPILAGLVFTCGSVAVPALLAVALAAGIAAWPTRHALAETLRARLPRPVVLLGFFAATVVMVGTAWLTHLRGLQAALVDPWVTWLAPYYPSPTPIPWLTALVLYDLPLLVGAGVGLAVVVRRNRPFDHFLLWWAALAALPLLVQPPNPLPYLLVWAVPLALLTGVALGELLALGWTWPSLGRCALLVALVVVDAAFAVNTLRLILSLVMVPGALATGGKNLLFSFVILLILLGIHAALRDWWRAESPTRAAALGALAFALIFVFATNGRLNYANSGAGNAELLRPEAMSPALYDLLDDVQTWARQEPTATIAVGEALRPSLLWHLRNVPTAQFQARPGEPLIRGLWPAGPEAPDGERRTYRETVAIGPIAGSSDLWNWWLYRKSWLVPTHHDIIVVR
jgi:hypothetical protein